MAFLAGNFPKRKRSKQMSDIQIFIIDRDGGEHAITAPTDMSLNLMEILRAQEPSFVEGTCGGMALCASCQVYLESDRPDLLEINDQEAQMLDEAFHVQKNSRLACQIPIKANLNQTCFRVAGPFIKKFKETLSKSIIFSAPSGSGKSTIITHLLEKFPALSFSVSACSRKPRDGEIDGKDYHFIGLEKFKENIKKNDFFEWEEVYQDNFYGTLKSELEKIWAQHKIAVFDVDVAGALQLKEKLQGQVISCFISVSDIEELKRRLIKRGTDEAKSIEKRIEKAKKELVYRNQFDFVIENDDKVEAFIRAEKMVEELIEK